MSVVIYPPTLDWHWMKQRPQQLMRRLAAAGHKVYFCNRTQAARPVQTVEPDLHVVHDHERWLSEQWPAIRRSARGKIGVWCSLPFRVREATRDYAPDWLVYDCADEMAEWLRYEKEAVAAADAVVCSSARLKERLARSYPDKRIELVRNGYDRAMNLHAGPPGAEADPAVSEPGKRRIGYIGAWAPWIDVPLVRELARLPDAEVVAVGPEFGRKYGPTAGSVRFVGLKPHEELPGYIRSFSVCVIPFRVTPLTLAVNPVKAYEYLAAGKPVVSAALPECGLMAPHVDIAPDRPSFVQAVSRRLESPGDGEERRRFALANSWERRGAAIAALIGELESR
ncbi:glycosyltransferase [Cohnella massiliensis]|uniref:glycosyltransferase n=1 Tax=Cohnella massiliensis TaxID=1816691 RepID=UPI0009BBB26E|nr:glycosyltransferase [Cohnella massiliensis]